ncbi:hypothetical protein VTN02DRAFT_1051 [Thermoascus thermophilus]
MRPEDVAAVGLLEEDGREEWDPWVDVLAPGGRVDDGHNPPRRGPLLALSGFNRLVELASVLNRLAREPSLTDPAPLRRILLDLRRWEDRLPRGCRLIGPDSLFPERHPTLLPHQTFLCLTLGATLLSLYGRLLAPRPPPSSSPPPHGLQRSALEGAKRILFRTLPLLSQYADNFRGFGLPPLFEFALRSIVDAALQLRDPLESDAFSVPRWMASLLQRLSAVDNSRWPVFAALTAAIEHGRRFGHLPGSTWDPPGVSEASSPGGGEATARRRRAAETAGHSQDGARPGPQDGALASTDDLESGSPATILGIPIPVDGGDSRTPPDSAAPAADGSSTMVSARMLSPRDAPDLMNLVSVPQPAPPTPESSISNPLLRPAAADPRGQRSAEHSPPPNDIDSLFQDLAYLDTNEWVATRRGEGRKEVGLFEEHAVHEFCNDPDRLGGSQPLVRPPSIADIWPPPGFFPEMFQEDQEEMRSRGAGEAESTPS